MAISSPTASKMAESFRVDAGLLHKRNSLDSDATLIPEGGLDDMVFPNVKVNQDKDQYQLYLVSANVTKPSEINLVEMIGERYHCVISPKLS